MRIFRSNMARCIICNEEYFSGGWYEPPEPCLCGQGAHKLYWESTLHALWQYDRFQAIFSFLRYRLAALLFRIANRLIMVKYGS